MPDKTKSAEKWLSAVAQRGEDAAEKKWVERGKKIVRRYRDEREMDNEGSRFNILWSNIETIFPATYARTPKADVTRRYKSPDPVARCAAQIIERALQYEIDQYPDFDETMRLAIKDRLLPGRGVAWVRFETYDVSRPEEAQVPENQAEVGQVLAAETPATPDVLERACVDYVYWEDFRHSQARTWSDVTWVARRVYMTKKAGIERFGDGFRDVPLTQEPVGLDDQAKDQAQKKAEVWEVWDKDGRTVVWVAKGYPAILDERADPYGLEGFFPCPKPLYATQTSDQITPVPDFSLYQDQAEEVDLLTTRIAGLVKALRLAGAYDASQPALARILESSDNSLIPVEDWAVFSEKGGALGAISWVPIKDVAAALTEAYAAREQAKQVIYEITGLSDIIRGATKASETATAQQIKSQFGSLRLKDRQHDIAVFATELLRIKAELMMDLYSPQTLLAMSGIEQTMDAQYAQQAIMLLKQEPLRNYQIEIAADSLVAIDEAQEKQDTMEFLGAAGGFIEKAVQAVQTVPELGPLAMEMLMMGVRAFKAGRPIEAAFEQLQQQMAQRPPQDPNAAGQAQAQAQQQIEGAKLQQKAQADQARLQADIQAQQVKAQADMQIERERMQMQAQLERERAQLQAQVDAARAQADAQTKQALESAKLQFERWKTELEMATRIEIANITSKAKLDDPATKTATREIADEVKP